LVHRCKKIGSILIPRCQGCNRPVIQCLEVESFCLSFSPNAYNLDRESNLTSRIRSLRGSAINDRFSLRQNFHYSQGYHTFISSRIQDRAGTAERNTAIIAYENPFMYTNSEDPMRLKYVLNRCGEHRWPSEKEPVLLASRLGKTNRIGAKFVEKRAAALLT
jgi:hypothetical protein